jgi:hypothetical protein
VRLSAAGGPPPAEAWAFNNYLNLEGAVERYSAQATI